jgi:hypothetical protein
MTNEVPDASNVHKKTNSTHYATQARQMTNSTPDEPKVRKATTSTSDALRVIEDVQTHKDIMAAEHHGGTLLSRDIMDA